MKYSVASTLLLWAGQASALANDLPYPCDTFPSKLQPRLLYTGTITGEYIISACRYPLQGPPSASFSIGANVWDDNPFGFNLSTGLPPPNDFQNTDGHPPFLDYLSFQTFTIACKNNGTCDPGAENGAIYNYDTSNATFQPNVAEGYIFQLDHRMAFTGNVTREFPTFHVSLPLHYVSDTNLLCDTDVPGTHQWDWNASTPSNFRVYFSEDSASVSLTWWSGYDSASFKFDGTRTYEDNTKENSPAALDKRNDTLPMFVLPDGSSYPGGFCYTSNVKKVMPPSASSRLLPSISSIAALFVGVVFVVFIY